MPLAGLPSSCLPWQAAHLSSYTVAPFAASPLPGGSPVPSGGMPKNAASSSGRAAEPKPYDASCVCPNACSGASATLRQAAIQQILRMDIAHIPIRRDGPALDSIEVIYRTERPIRPTDGGELCQCRLDVSGFVGTAAL